MKVGDRVVTTEAGKIGSSRGYEAGWRGRVAPTSAHFGFEMVVFDHLPSDPVPVWTEDLRVLNVIERIGEIEVT